MIGSKERTVLWVPSLNRRVVCADVRRALKLAGEIAPPPYDPQDKLSKLMQTGEIPECNRQGTISFVNHDGYTCFELMRAEEA